MSDDDRTLTGAAEAMDPADEPINILLVDDEPKNLTVLETILDDPGYRLVKAGSADEALLALVSHEFALLVLDIQMPEMNGFELAKLIKQRRKTAGVPIIFLTAYYSQDEHILEGYGTGAVDYLHKPVNPAVLRSKTAIFAQLHRKSHEAERTNRALQAEVGQRRLAQEKLELMNSNLEHLVEARTASLRRSEAFARSVVESGADCIAVCSLDGSVQWTNGGGGWLAEIGVDWLAFWRRFGSEPHAVPALMAARAGGTGRFLTAGTEGDGRPHWWDVIVTPVPAPDGSPERILCVARDVTEQRDAEEALREAARHKDEFLAMLAHELRNPLVPIRNAVHVLRQTGPQDPTLVRMREMIDRQVTHMARLVDDLLDVSRLSRGKLKLHTRRIDLVQVVRDSTEDYRAALTSSGLSLTTTLPSEPVWVEGDRIRLAQVVTNLLHNAHKFTDKGGSVAVAVQLDETGNAVVRIQDTGVGMAPGFAARVFESFTQEEQSLDRSKGGLGMGLALVRGLVHLHGGVVEAQSGGPGKGSEFLIRLPCSAEGHTPSAGEATLRPRVDPVRILVIEDNKDAAESTRLVLALDGHHVAVAYTGPSGIETARSFGPQVVLCDIGLPEGMSGYDVVRALRKEPRAGSAFVIALTGYGREEDKRKAREAGFDLHLTKPIDYAELRSRLAGLTPRKMTGPIDRESAGAPSPPASPASPPSA